tara:strand:+ start:71 stop:820 length:750 start_codon:yes stop_codon:yes gene_type:complete
MKMYIISLASLFLLILVYFNFTHIKTTTNIYNNHCHALEYLTYSIKNSENGKVKIIYWIKNKNLEEFFDHIGLKVESEYGLFTGNLNKISLENDFSLSKYFTDKEKKLIYVTRGESKRRKIINEEKLIDYLKKKIKNIEILNLNNFSLLEQGNIFSNCQLFISLHGAAISNYHFMRKKSNVIELSPGCENYHDYDKKIKKLGINYYPLYLNNTQESEECFSYPRDSYSTIEDENIQDLDKIINEITENI